jgi:hypothetical protein
MQNVLQNVRNDTIQSLILKQSSFLEDIKTLREETKSSLVMSSLFFWKKGGVALSFVEFVFLTFISLLKARNT